MAQADMQQQGLPAHQIAAVAIGNALSFYDFVCYAFFATQIGRTFFPSADPTISLLASLATFGVGFFTRPLGGLIIGRMADRIGRKPAMMLSFGLMGIGIVGPALTPSYHSIGIAAPALFILFRLIQGFALGGEVGPTTAYLIEAAPPMKRGFYAAITYATQDGGVLVAGLIGTALAASLSDAALTSWGWRIAFLVGASIIPFGLYVRRNLPETLDESIEDVPTRLGPYLRIAILGLMMLLTGTVCNYAIEYMTTYAINTLHMDTTVAFGATVVIGIFNVTFDLVSGWTTDRFGRKPVMILPYVALFLLTLPAFYFISHYRTVFALYAASALLASLQCWGGGPTLTTVTESLPRRIRAGAVAVIYAISIAAFGGTTQFMISWIIAATGNPLAPAFYMMGGIAIGLIAMATIKETAPVKTGITEFR
ncbi:MAG: MFS transporter [Proteobacteria bacterium]|nr:MFS transporter [Pseudomonadota bacterium]